MTKTTARHIYFAAAVWANDYKTDEYKNILAELNKYGELTNTENYENPWDLNAEEVFGRMEEQLAKSNVIIAEVSTPSHGVGWEIAYGQFERKIPVLCLYKADKNPSQVLEWNVDLDVFPYETMDDVKKILKTYFTNRLE